MNASWGEATEMRETKTKEVGPFPSQLTIGQKQCMPFGEDDHKPCFWLTKAQKLSTKCNVTLLEKMKKRSELKAELLIEL